MFKCLFISLVNAALIGLIVFTAALENHWKNGFSFDRRLLEVDEL